MSIKNRLDELIQNNIYEVNEKIPDPVLIAHKYKDEYSSLIAALFAYGNVKAILKFLNSIDYSLCNVKETDSLYYRFQSSEDVYQFLKTVLVMKKNFSLNELFLKGYKKENNVIDGIREIIKKIYEINPYRSKGYEFLIGKIPPQKTKGTSPYKRWNMYIRWMVRDTYPDIGLWKNVKKSDLIIPLDTHTHKVSLKLGLLKRKTYDLEAAVELTDKLKEFDPEDPIKYDFALYRIGQMNIKF
ncbi:TIGR02757 family protein [Nautilia sp. PV-1]|uniref:TIGR02757 family protein n=1 Tax=Nautilia sp. PV-1 TaxID=2579250 RepID=UPI000FD96678|nr:TIGR02757 family protein [Nautilia sp. PV-1]AZV47159.1 TIGR02757 family protein [Nautilia sp. PV-1]